MKRPWAVGRAVDELANVRIGRRANLLGRAAGDNRSFGYEIQRVDHFQGFVYVVRHDHRRDAERVVQTSYQLAYDAERNRIEPGKWLVVHDQHRIERDGARQRDAATHASRQLGGHQLRGAAEADRVKLHQHEVTNDLLGQLGVLTHRKRDVLKYAHVGEQRTELKQHPATAPQRVQRVRFEIGPRVPPTA